MIKVVVVLGTRPEAVKMAPVIKALQARSDQFDTTVCDVGQHRDMVHHILNLFAIVPDEQLDIMRPGQTLYHVTAATLQQLEPIFKRIEPDVVLVQGDTSTAMTAALAGFYDRLQVGHVEAGLRTHNKYAPYPEEVNRKLIGSIADYHFAPTDDARQNLLKEQIPDSQIHVTGNTVVDALMHLQEALDGTVSEVMDDEFHAKYGLDLKRRMILITCHRRESFGDALSRICQSIRDLAQMHQDIDFVYPVHPNPNVKDAVERALADVKNVYLLPPLAYDRFLYLMKKSTLLLTDSGGVQEEAYVFRKPLVVLRTVTERQEAVQAGYAWLVGSDPEKIITRVNQTLSALDEGVDFFTSPNPYGDGLASQRIADILMATKTND